MAQKHDCELLLIRNKYKKIRCEIQEEAKRKMEEAHAEEDQEVHAFLTRTARDTLKDSDSDEQIDLNEVNSGEQSNRSPIFPLLDSASGHSFDVEPDVSRPTRTYVNVTSSDSDEHEDMSDMEPDPQNKHAVEGQAKNSSSLHEGVVEYSSSDSDSDRESERPIIRKGLSKKSRARDSGQGKLTDFFPQRKLDSASQNQSLHSKRADEFEFDGRDLSPNDLAHKKRKKTKNACLTTATTASSTKKVSSKTRRPNKPKESATDRILLAETRKRKEVADFVEQREKEHEVEREKVKSIHRSVGEMLELIDGEMKQFRGTSNNVQYVVD